MPFDATDLNYISKKLASPPEILKSLSEEERDADLLLNHVCIKDIKRGDSRKINPLTYIKLVVFRYSHDLDFDIDEKDYVAKTVYSTYPSLKDCYNYNFINTNKLGEQKSQHLLMAAGLFDDKIPVKILYPNYKKDIEEGFKGHPAHLKQFPAHINEWIDVLKEINKKKWLSNK